MKKSILQRAVLAAAISTVSSGSMAAGFALQETSSAGLGRAYAAENTIGDTAAILARNPAGSALFKETTLSGGFIYVDPEIDIEGNVTYFTPLGATTFENEQANDYASSAVVPHGYLAVPFDPCWSFGLSLFTNYGLETDFDNDYLTTTMANKTELLTVNVAPSIAYNYNDVFSIGLAANFLYADATLKTNIPEGFPLDPTASGASILKLTGDDWDVSWSIGALWNITERTRLGLSYHAELDPKLDGKVSSDILPTAALAAEGLPPEVLAQFPPFDNNTGKLTLDLPDTWELGLYHKFNDNWGLALGVMYTDWDDFERLEAFIPDADLSGVIGEPGPFNPLLIKEENFQSGWRYSVGLEYYPCDEVTWRVGYAYDEGAARDGLNEVETLAATDAIGGAPTLPITWRTLSIPDADRNWVTFGGSYQFDDHLSVDGGFAYLWGNDKTVREFTNIPVPTYFDGNTTNIEAWLAGVSLNYSF